MSVRVMRVSGMPYNTEVWVDDRDDGRFIVYIDRKLITKRGARALQTILGTTITGWKRIDTSLVYSCLRAVTG